MTSHSKIFESSTRPAEKPSTGFFFSSNSIGCQSNDQFAMIGF